MVALSIKGNELGSLVAIEAGKDVPFEIARVYYIFGTLPGVVRGLHAHRKLRQLIIAVSGACTMTLDDANERTSIRLDNPAEGLILGPNVWREMSDFSADCVLMVLADSFYDLNDYITDYDTFCRGARELAQ